MSKKLTKKTKVLNLLSKGKNVTWKTLRTRFDLASPTAMIHTLRKEGHAIYRNMTPSGVAFRLGTPTKIGGLSEDIGGPSFSSCSGVLIHCLKKSKKNHDSITQKGTEKIGNFLKNLMGQDF